MDKRRKSASKEEEEDDEEELDKSEEDEDEGLWGFQRPRRKSRIRRPSSSLFE